MHIPFAFENARADGAGPSESPRGHLHAAMRCRRDLWPATPRSAREHGRLLLAPLEMVEGEGAQHSTPTTTATKHNGRGLCSPRPAPARSGAQTRRMSTITKFDGRREACPTEKSPRGRLRAVPNRHRTPSKPAALRSSSPCPSPLPHLAPNAVATYRYGDPLGPCSAPTLMRATKPSGHTFGGLRNLCSSKRLAVTL